MSRRTQTGRGSGRRRTVDRIPVASILLRVLGITAVVGIAFWVITAIGIRTNQNSEADLAAVSVLNDVKAAQEESFTATGEYLTIDALISAGFLTAPAADATAPTVEDVNLAVGDDCFVIAVRSASDDVYYNWSQPRSSKKLDPDNPPDTAWCAPFPTPEG